MEALIDGQVLPLGGPKQQALLACLVLRVNEVVDAGHIVTSLWYRPPKTAATMIHMYVSRVRRLLTVPAEEPTIQLVTRPGGYVLRADRLSVDVNYFDVLLREGNDLLERARPSAARDRFQQALDLWRGPPLSGLDDEPVGVGARVQLEGLHMAAIEHRIEADLSLGRHLDVVPELERLNAEHPLREGIASKLMVALYRSGRQADALRIYDRLRRTLDDELGLEPATALQRLQHAVLTHDSGLELERSPDLLSLLSPRS